MEKRLRYRLITGKDDASFCERVSRMLGDGYELYGSPSITFNGKEVIAAQAVILSRPAQRQSPLIPPGTRDTQTP